MSVYVLSHLLMMTVLFDLAEQVLRIDFVFKIAINIKMSKKINLHVWFNAGIPGNFRYAMSRTA
jgi:hypothetical protein